jgi:hypothetical protein
MLSSQLIFSLLVAVHDELIDHRAWLAIRFIIIELGLFVFLVHGVGSLFIGLVVVIIVG